MAKQSLAARLLVRCHSLLGHVVVVNVLLGVLWMTCCGAAFVLFRHELTGVFIGAETPPDAAERIRAIGASIFICAAIFQTLDADPTSPGRATLRALPGGRDVDMPRTTAQEAEAWPPPPSTATSTPAGMRRPPPCPSPARDRCRHASAEAGWARKPSAVARCWPVS